MLAYYSDCESAPASEIRIIPSRIIQVDEMAPVDALLNEDPFRLDQTQVYTPSITVRRMIDSLLSGNESEAHAWFELAIKQNKDK